LLQSVAQTGFWSGIGNTIHNLIMRDCQQVAAWFISPGGANKVDHTKQGLADVLCVRGLLWPGLKQIAFRYLTDPSSPTLVCTTCYAGKPAVLNLAKSFVADSSSSILAAFDVGDTCIGQNVCVRPECR
jgi:hypothetical protein